MNLFSESELLEIRKYHLARQSVIHPLERRRLRALNVSIDFRDRDQLLQGLCG